MGLVLGGTRGRGVGVGTEGKRGVRYLVVIWEGRGGGLGERAWGVGI